MNRYKDFKNLLIQDESVQRDAFWGKYTGLENQEIPPIEKSLFDYQIEQLEDFEMRTGGQQYALANDFLQEVNSLNIPELESQTENEVYARLIQVLNVLFNSSDESVFKKIVNENETRWATTQEKEQDSKKYAAELSNLISQLKIGKAFPEDFIKKFENTIRGGFASKNTKNSSKFKKREYIQLKADIAEKIMVEFLNKNPLFKSIQTGNWLHNNEQIIEDVMTFSEDIPLQAGSSAIFYKTGEKKSGIKKVFNNLAEFLEESEKASEQGLKIELSKELYEALQDAATFRSQVKSGISQDILNAQSTKRNSLELGKTKFKFQDIWLLFTEDQTKYFFNKDGKSKELMALANYCLSEAIGETQLSKNQVYYTSQGFMTASNWMRTHKRMLVFNPDIEQLEEGMLNKPYSYIFEDVEKYNI